MLPILFLFLSVIRPSYSSGVEWKQEWVEKVDQPYEDIKSKKKFQKFWDEVDERLQFSPEKVLRLVFPTKGKMQK